MNPMWISIGISLLAVLVGTATNLFVIGRFFGRWSETTKNITATLEKVERRLEDVEGKAEEGDSQRLLMDGRLKIVEGGVDRFWQMRDEFVTMRTTVEINGKHQNEKLESLGRSVSVIERQIGNLVSTRAAGFVTLTSEEKN